MRKIAKSEEYSMPATIDDPAILDKIRAVLQTISYAAKNKSITKNA
jgi:propionyl-CoA synthetase